MNLSMRWLSEYVKVDVSPRQYAEDLTMSGSKVEGYEIEGTEISGVIVGKILSITPHENAESLVICSVDVGAAEPLQIVTGAKNLTVGDVVPVATNGAKLPGGKEIHSAPLRGVMSEGMLCSLSELGLTVNDFPYALENGIFVLQEDCKLGQDIQSAIGLNDTIVEFEITSNRPDCLSLLGLARETATTYHQNFVPKTPVVKGNGGNIHDLLSVEVQNTTLCPRYMARMVKNIKVAPSPRWLRERLRASGIRPINNIVDITNYVMLEYGQPLHAFDSRFVADNKIIVRNAVEGETITTLDGVERTLTTDMLVIADAQKPSAVAGVMGGEYSSIVEDTNTIIFESANFLGSSVRITAKKLGMRTESSSRFEKGLDPMNCYGAVQRACELVELLGAGEVVDGIIDVDASNHTPKTIELNHNWINSFLGINLSKDEMITILQNAGFAVESDIITVPSFRTDVEHKADIAEEVARFYGYNKIPTTAIKGSVEGAYTPRQIAERKMVQNLVASGLNEITTFTFISPKYYDKIRLEENSPLRRSVIITNPLGEDTSVMRTTAIPSMLEVIARNINNNNKSAALFEIAKEFTPKESADILPDEKQVITLGLYGDNSDFFTLKGIVEKLLASFGINHLDVSAITNNPTFHPGRTAEVAKDGVILGLIGQIHPLAAQNYGIDQPVYVGRLDVDAILSIGSTEKTYRSMPRFPASVRDIAITCDKALPVLTLEKAIRASAPSIIEEVALFDVYTGIQLGEGRKSVAYTISFRAPDRTLVDSEIQEAMSAILKAVNALGGELRS